MPTLGCGRSSEPARPSASSEGSFGSVELEPPPTANVASLPPPKRLLATRGAPYSATLSADDERIYLLTSDAAFRLAPGKTPERRSLSLGPLAVARRDDLVYFSGDAIHRIDKDGNDRAVVAKLDHAPRQLVGSTQRLAWLEHDDGEFRIEAPDGVGVRRLYATTADVTAMSMDDDAVYFVERAPDRSWRFGKASLSGSPPSFTSARRGRTPAMIAIERALYYYDGPSSTIRRLTLDLGREDVVATNVICSPIAVAQHVYCAQPAGIVEISLDGVSRRVLPMPHGVTITAISATDRWLAWVSDAGDGRLTVDWTQLGANYEAP